MADEVVIEHAGGQEMSGMGGWFLLLITIVIGVIVGILVLDLIVNLVPSTETGP